MPTSHPRDKTLPQSDSQDWNTMSPAKIVPAHASMYDPSIQAEGGHQLHSIDLEKSQAQVNKALSSEVHDQLMKDSEPLALTNSMVEKPCRFILCGYLFLIVIMVISSGLKYFEMSPITERDYLIWDNEKTEAWDKMVLAEEYILGGGGVAEDKPIRLTKVQKWNPLVLYRARDGGNLISKDRLIRVRNIEEKMKAHEKWEDVCLAESIVDTSCSKSEAFISVLSFMPLADMLEPIENYSDEELQQGFDKVRTDPAKWSFISNLFEKSDLIEQNEGRVTFMRSFMSMALPLDVNGTRYQSAIDREDDQKDYITSFHMDLYNDLLEFADDQDLYPQVMSQNIFEELALKIAEEDAAWVGFSILSVFLFFVWKLRSSFLATMSILIIVNSLPVAQFISEGVLRNTYFSTLHNIVIFIILGIGADNIFVYADSFSHTKTIPEIMNDKQRRVAYAFKRTARATATTSSTTSIAFLANAFSPIMPIASFGIFAAVVIAMNYFLVIMIFPSVALWYEDHLEGRWCCCGAKRSVEGSMNQAEAPQLGATERFFGGAWNSFVNKFKYPIILLFVIWVGTSIALTTQLSALTKPEEFLEKEHPLQEITLVQQENFLGGGIYTLNVDVYWGVKGLDKDGTSKWDAENIGSVIMDKGFDLSPPEAQQSLLDFCDDLKSQDFVLNEQVTCWMDQFKAYVEAEGKTLPIEYQADFEDTLFTWADSAPEGMQAKAGMLVGFSGKKLSFFKVKAVSQGNPLAPADMKDVWFQKWENYVEAYRQNAPASMGSAQQTAGLYWAFIPSEKEFISSAFQGIAIAMGFAFLVLFIATGNIAQAAISLVCVASINLGVLAIMKMSGWEVGALESMAMVMLIGFSVDYVVHLSADYMHSAHQSRHDKMKQAYTEMGVSVLSGAITTFSSGVFLFGGQTLFFQKFALLITATITLSFLFSTLLFGAFMHAFGPENGFGNLGCGNQKTSK